MIKLLLLQAWYGLSDQELEYQASNRIDFMRFLGFPDKAPDYSTVWRFRERLAKTGKDKEIWDELQRQLDLSLPGEVVYRDSGYFGVKSKGYNATMQRGVRGRSVSLRDQLRNRRISRK